MDVRGERRSETVDVDFDVDVDVDVVVVVDESEVWICASGWDSGAEIDGADEV